MPLTSPEPRYRLMPASVVRLSAGRTEMNEATQALCFLAGANSIFYGDTLLTTPNPEQNEDLSLFDRLGIVANGEQAGNSGDAAA